MDDGVNVFSHIGGTCLTCGLVGEAETKDYCLQERVAKRMEEPGCEIICEAPATLAVMG